MCNASQSAPVLAFHALLEQKRPNNRTIIASPMDLWADTHLMAPTPMLRLTPRSFKTCAVVGGRQ